MESEGPDGGGAPLAATPSQRIGIAQFFTEADPRTGHHGERAYETTTVLDKDELPSTQAYDLVLTGRLTRLRGGRVITLPPANEQFPT